MQITLRPQGGRGEGGPDGPFSELALNGQKCGKNLFLTSKKSKKMHFVAFLRLIKFLSHFQSSNSNVLSRYKCTLLLNNDDRNEKHSSVTKICREIEVQSFRSKLSKSFISDFFFTFNVYRLPHLNLNEADTLYTCLVDPLFQEKIFPEIKDFENIDLKL